MRRSPLHTRRRALRWAFGGLLVLTGGSLVACADTLPPTAAPPVEEAARPSAGTRDGDIQKDDSHFTARVRITGSGGGASLREASAQASAQAPPGEETLYIEGGYGAQGELRFGVYWEASPGASVRGIRAVGDRIEMLNAQGQVLSSRPFDAQMAEAGLPGGTLIGAYFPSGEPGLVTCRAGDPGCGPGAALREETPVGGIKELRRTLRASGAAASGASEDRTESVRRYRKVAKDSWRLEEVRQTAYVLEPRGLRVTETVTHFTYGAWNRDLVKDSARAAAPRVHAAEIPRAPAPSELLRPANAPLPAAPDPADVFFGICDRGTAETNIARSKSSGGLSIVYQHGFCADASVWDGMRPRIASAHNVVRERAFSLATTARAEDQVTELRTRLLQTDPRSNLVIGHSLGGLLARRLGQRDPSLVSGVITIGSPNGGARIAQIGPEAAAELIEVAAGRYCVGDWLCQRISMLLADQYAGKLLFGAPGFLPPVLQDLAPNSPFLQTLNNTTEPFPRAGIEVDAGNRWAVFRMLGDSRSPRTRVITGERPSGHSWVEKAEEVYRAAQWLQFLSLFAQWNVSANGGGVNCQLSGYSAFWTPCSGTDWQSSWNASWNFDFVAFLVYQLSTFVVASMDFVDHTWDWITTGTVDRTDGLVALQAQRYPNAPGVIAPVRVLITPPEADSHSGETASPRVVERTIDLIRTLGLAGR